MAWIAVVPSSPRHPHERYQVCYREGTRQRSAGVFPTKRRAEAERRAIERGRTELTGATGIDLEQKARTLLGEYVTKYYIPAARQGHRYNGQGFDAAKQVAQWKTKVRAAWPGVALRRVDTPARRIPFGESVPVEIAAKLNGLTPADVRVELILTRSLREAAPVSHTHELAASGDARDGEHRFHIDLKPALAGRLDYRIRIYPRHELLTHPHELGLATWL